MKNKVFALLIFSVTLLGLAFYLLTVFEDDIVFDSRDSIKQNPTAQKQQVSLVPIQEEEKTVISKEPDDIGGYEAVFRIDEKNYFLQRNIDSLELRDTDKNILGVFPYAEQRSLQKVYGNTQVLLFTLGETRYIIDTSGVQFQFELVPEIIYAKKNNNQYIYKTDKGIFMYDIQKKTIEYQPLFSDFIVYNGNTYVAVIAKNEVEKQKLFGINATTDVIVTYNTNTKEKDIILKLEQPIEKIYESGKAIYVETSEGDILRLRNLK